MRTLLIDGDILVVSTCAALQQEIDIGDDEWALTTDVAEVKRTLLETIERMQMDLEADAAIVALSKGETFRHKLYPGYKAGRARKPVGTAEVKRWLVEEHGAKLIPGIEADDVLGILATNPRIVKGEKIICSQDKDLQTIPGLLYRNGEIEEISDGEAYYNFLFQTLAGDTTDGYPGCPGVGPKKAKQLLDGIEPGHDPWFTIRDVFEKAGLTEDDALMQARMARILHSSDFNFKTKEPILWRPSSWVLQEMLAQERAKQPTV